MDGIRIKNIKGTIVDYTILTAENGYCFYDTDDEQQNYVTSITTPITERSELERKYVAVWGDADELNGKLDEERQRRLEDDGSGI